MLFAYAPDEAERAFREAARLDPGLAMAWWGIGESLGPNINVEPTPETTANAAEAVTRAKLLATAHATESEREYISALETRYTSAADPDFDGLATAYRDAMRTMVQKHPDDPDARALLAEAIMDVRPWRLWDGSGNPEPGTSELVEVIEQGLARHPNHIGLLHFYIHAVEASRDAARALPAARRLAALPMEPAAAHLVHMPAHIYMRVGDWQSAVEANEHATHGALDYRLSTDPKSQHACAHCADFLSYAYMMQGSQAHARKSADDFQKMSDDPTNTIAVLVRFRRWNEVLALPEVPADLKTFAHNTHEIRGFLHFARGLAFAAEGHVDQARSELQALRSETDLAPAAASFDGPLDVRHVQDKTTQTIDAIDLQLAAAILDSRIAVGSDKLPEAIALMRTAARLQDEIPYTEPPPWFYPVRESLGALLLRSGSAAESEAVFRESLREAPNNPRCLLGLAAALEAQGKKTEAATARSRFEAAWQHSDTQLEVNDL
jgi:tetratricopeptide (TPR) repeat protein